MKLPSEYLKEMKAASQVVGQSAEVINKIAPLAIEFVPGVREYLQYIYDKKLPKIAKETKEISLGLSTAVKDAKGTLLRDINLDLVNVGDLRDRIFNFRLQLKSVLDRIDRSLEKVEKKVVTLSIHDEEAMTKFFTMFSEKDYKRFYILMRTKRISQMESFLTQFDRRHNFSILWIGDFPSTKYQITVNKRELLIKIT
jgi:hypothetical protein